MHFSIGLFELAQSISQSLVDCLNLADVIEGRKNAALLAKCDELHALQADTVLVFGPMDWAGDLDAAYVQAFADYGIDLAGEDVVLALETLLTSHMGPEVALALDDWGRLSRRVHGARAEKTRNLAFLAMDLDFDPERRRLREAILADDL